MAVAQISHPRAVPGPIGNVHNAGLSVLLWGAGLACLGGLALAVYSHPRIYTASNPGLALYEFLQALGVVRPLILLFGGLRLMRLGVGLARREIGAARWVRQLLAWTLIGLPLLGVVLLWAEWHAGTLLSMDKISQLAIGAVLLEAALLYAYSWMSRHMAMYLGLEHTQSSAARTAWTLLLPTLLVMLAIAATPLENVFITSLTDQRFASSDPFSFVGLDNYVRLFSIRLDNIPCQTDPSGACQVQDGQTVYPRLNDYLGADYRQQRYRAVIAFDVIGNHFVLSGRDPDFVASALNTILYTLVAVFFQVTIGLAMALVLRSRFKGVGLMRVALLIPLAIPTLIATQFWTVMFYEGKTGLLNSALIGLGVIQQAQGWLLNPQLQILSLVLVIVWKETPSIALMLLPGLVMIPQEVYEAAQVDGAGCWQQFTRITLPLIRPLIGVALVLRTMQMLRVFDIFDIFLGRNRFSMATYTFNTLLEKQQLGYSSAISASIFLIMLVFTVIYMRTLRVDQA